jgi:tetratricopeptide (TPR) repeat protein
LSLLILLAIVIWAIATRRFSEWREILFLTVPPLFYLAIAMGSGMNIGIRHILPMYLFFAVLIGGATSKLIQANRKWAYAVAVLLLFQAISVSRTFPAYVAYANELWGGPSNVHTLLSDSNADWAQQLKSVKTYLDGRNIKDCWFIYFAEGVIDTRYYGLPCKQLPTADSLWVREPLMAPPVVEGTVLISAGDHSGFEFGPGKLNPYEEFKSLKPKDIIDYGVLVYEGRFEIPLAASIGHEQQAQFLREEKRLPEALAEAQKAVEFAPYAVGPNALVGDLLTDLNRADEARPYYEKALANAKSVEPEFQIGWVAGLEKKLNGNKPAAP